MKKSCLCRIRGVVNPNRSSPSTYYTTPRTFTQIGQRRSLSSISTSYTTQPSLGLEGADHCLVEFPLHPDPVEQTCGAYDTELPMPSRRSLPPEPRTILCTFLALCTAECEEPADTLSPCKQTNARNNASSPLSNLS